MIKINIDVVFQYIYLVTRYYVPNIPNKKKIKQLFESIPFFIPKDQSLLFDIIKENSIVNYYDTNDQMITYGYIIYETYHKRKKIPFLDIDHYVKHYDSLLFVQEPPNYKKYIIVLSIIIMCIYFIYAS
jgi:hypothetical protein